MYCCIRPDYPGTSIRNAACKESDQLGLFRTRESWLTALLYACSSCLGRNSTFCCSCLYTKIEFFL